MGCILLAIILLLKDFLPSVSREADFYTPLDCFERSYALEPSCPLASACFPNFPCPMVYSGTFNRQTKVYPSCIHRDPHNPPVKKMAMWYGGMLPTTGKVEHDLAYYDKPVCNDTATRKGDRGHFLSGRWIDRKLNRTLEIENSIVRDDYCEYRWFCPEEIYNATNNYVFVFIGDSLIRQVFNRFIWHHRGLQEIIEHYYHTDAHYTSSLTHDFFTIKTITNTSLLINVDKGSGSIDALFFWSTEKLMDKILWVDKNIIQQGRFQHRPVAFITGIGHHYKGVKEGYLESIIGRLTEFHEARIFNTTNRLFWLPVPGNAVRNRYIREWDVFHDTYVLPLDRIARSKVFGYDVELVKEKEGIHFQCAYTENDNGIMHFNQLRLRQFKTPRSGDCRDLPNLNIVMIILSIISQNQGKVYAYSKSRSQLEEQRYREKLMGFGIS